MKTDERLNDSLKAIGRQNCLNLNLDHKTDSKLFKLLTQSRKRTGDKEEKERAKGSCSFELERMMQQKSNWSAVRRNLFIYRLLSYRISSKTRKRFTKL